MVSPVCFYAISVLKKHTDYDDALDVFGCHGVGGIFGGLCTAVFTTPNLALDKANFGLIYGNARLFVVTVLAIVLHSYLVGAGNLWYHKSNWPLYTFACQ